MQRIALILLFQSCAMVLAAQKPIVSNQQVFKTEDGLPKSLISGVVQDRDGFIWIGTQGGLARYDGRSFKTFSKKQLAGAGFRSQVINGLAYNSNNHIAVFYQGDHVDDFDPLRFMVTTAEEKQTQLYYQSEGINGIFLFDEEKWEKILFNLLSTPQKSVDLPPASGVYLSPVPFFSARKKCFSPCSLQAEKDI